MGKALLHEHEVKMGKMIKVRCDGPGKHVNTVDVEAVLETDVILRSTGKGKGGRSIPKRLVLPCRECAVGKVIITRDMIEANLGAGKDD
ncbi:MAG: hypothetical protein ABIK83_02780 [Candidatus Zixiibacteriota bacterium]